MDMKKGRDGGREDGGPRRRGVAQAGHPSVRSHCPVLPVIPGQWLD